MSKIEWTEKTLNIVTGCTKISEGCQNCYAEKMHRRLQAMGQKKYSKPFNEVNFCSVELVRNFGKTPKRIFVNSMSDTFHSSLSDYDINCILGKCKVNPQNIFQILTKRSERLTKFIPFKGELGREDYEGIYPENVWLGVTVELAKYKDRIEHLKQTNAKTKFLSCEPLLGDLGELDLKGIDWVIVGGESGHNARPMHPDWVRNIQRQCKEQGVPFFFKQWGEYVPANELPADIEGFNTTKIGGNTILLNVPIKYINDYPLYHVGKKKAGCLLDGKEYKEYPKEV